MATPLSPHFTLEELIATNHRTIDNRPKDQVIFDALKDTAERMEKVRELLGNKVISVSSGFRCPELNTAVGSSPRSAHTRGHAVDFNCYTAGNPLEVCKQIAASGLEYDQLIHEFGSWVHIGFLSPDGTRRGQELTIDRQGTRPGLVPIR